MARKPTGTITPEVLSDGTCAFRLRFRANGDRERDTLHERRGCNCGCGGGWTERTAQVELENILARVQAGIWRPGERAQRSTLPAAKAAVPTFHEYSSWWLQAKTDGVIGRKPLRANSRADYLWRLQRHLLPFFGRYRLTDIDKQLCLAFKAHKLREAGELRDTLAAGADIRDPRTHRKARPLDLSSIAKLIDTLAAILDEAIEDEHIGSNPARSRRMDIQVPEPEHTFLEMDELVALIDAAHAADAPATVRAATQPAPGTTAARVAELLANGQRPVEIAAELGISKATVSYHVRRLVQTTPGDYIGRRAVVSTLAYSGVRVSELCDMKIGHVRVHDAKGSRFRIPDSKTQAGVRVVEMTPDLVEEWTMHLDRLRRAGHPTGPDAWAFPNTRGGRITRQRVGAIVRDAALDATTQVAKRGLPPLPRTTPHSLRRTYITIALMANNFDVMFVMAQVGHEDSKMTMDVYAQLQQRAKREHSTAFDAKVREAREQFYGTPLTVQDVTGGPETDPNGSAIGTRSGFQADFDADRPTEEAA